MEQRARRSSATPGRRVDREGCLVEALSSASRAMRLRGPPRRCGFCSTTASHSQRTVEGRSPPRITKTRSSSRPARSAEWTATAARTCLEQHWQGVGCHEASSDLTCQALKGGVTRLVGARSGTEENFSRAKVVRPVAASRPSLTLGLPFRRSIYLHVGNLSLLASAVRTGATDWPLGRTRRLQHGALSDVLRAFQRSDPDWRPDFQTALHIRSNRPDLDINPPGDRICASDRTVQRADGVNCGGLSEVSSSIDLGRPEILFRFPNRSFAQRLPPRSLLLPSLRSISGLPRSRSCWLAPDAYKSRLCLANGGDPPHLLALGHRALPIVVSTRLPTSSQRNGLTGDDARGGSLTSRASGRPYRRPTHCPAGSRKP